VLYLIEAVIFVPRARAEIYLEFATLYSAPQSTERQMQTTGLSSCALYGRLCCLPSSCESSIGNPIEFAIVLRRARTELDWEFASLYSVTLRTQGTTWLPPALYV
jgi:hypothetical protein